MPVGAILAGHESVPSLAERVTALEQRPRVVPPQSLLPRRVGTPSVFGDWFAQTNSPTFADLFRVMAPLVTQRGLFCSLLMTDNGATGEARVVIANSTGTVTSNVHSYTGSGSGNATLAWLHDLDLWTGGDVTVTVQGRRVTGAQHFFVNLPSVGFADTVSMGAAGGIWHPGVWLP